MNEANEGFLIRCLGEDGIEEFKLEHLFRATRDSCLKKVFVEKCYEKGPTLILIRTEFDKVVACFANVSWKDLHQQGE